MNQPAEEILKHARQYAVREDILAAAEANDLPEAQAVALLKMREPLGAVYEEFENRDRYYKGVVLESLEACSVKAAGLSQENRPSIREQLKPGPSEQSSDKPAKDHDQER